MRKFALIRFVPSQHLTTQRFSPFRSPPGLQNLTRSNGARVARSPAIPHEISRTFGCYPGRIFNSFRQARATMIRFSDIALPEHPVPRWGLSLWLQAGESINGFARKVFLTSALFDRWATTCSFSRLIAFDSNSVNSARPRC
jgi:hypothetical protein